MARVGELIDAPVRPVRLIYVDDALTDGIRVDGYALPGGTHVGSEVLPQAEELTTVDRISHDGNARRFAAYLALWELCLGTDPQLLYDLSQSDTVWSIDHGLWFESLESDWTEEHLDSRIDEPWPPPRGSQLGGLAADALLDAADRLGDLSEQELSRGVAAVPLEWGVSDEQLTTLAAFIDKRRVRVAKRLRDLAARTGKGT